MQRILFIVACLVAATGAQTLSWDFESGYQEWIADFADYPVNDSVLYKLSQKHGIIPDVTPADKGIILEGHNYSDDLFLWMKTRKTGLKPNTEYSLVFTIVVAATLPPDGIGGGSMYLKGGATVVEPKKVASAGNMYRMNVDVGKQANGGPAAHLFGFIQHDVPGSFKHHLVSYNNAAKPFKVKTDGQGTLWILVGAESTFEVPCDLKVASVKLEMTEGPTALAPASALAARPSARRAFTPDGRRVEARPGMPRWLAAFPGTR